jgi:four helix bundle protein
MGKIRSHEELHVFQLAFEASMKIFEISRDFPKEEKYSMIDQIRRSSRSVCANLAEAFRKRKYPKYFVAKLMDCEGEAAETQVWLLYALKCKYIDQVIKDELNDKYNLILGKLVVMGQQPEKWTY